MLSLKNKEEFNAVDVKNAFRLLSKEYSSDRSGMIKLDRVHEILLEINVPEEEIEQLIV